MPILICPRCSGLILRFYDSVECINCGYSPNGSVEEILSWAKRKLKKLPEDTRKMVVSVAIDKGLR